MTPEVRTVAGKTYRVHPGRSGNIEVQTPGGNWRRVQSIPIEPKGVRLSQWKPNQTSEEPT